MACIYFPFNFNNCYPVNEDEKVHMPAIYFKIQMKLEISIQHVQVCLSWNLFCFCLFENNKSSVQNETEKEKQKIFFYLDYLKEKLFPIIKKDV